MKQRLLIFIVIICFYTTNFIFSTATEDDTEFAWFPDFTSNTIYCGVHSPVNVFDAALTLETRLVFNHLFRIQLIGSFYNAANFKDYYNDESGDTADSYSEKNWSNIADTLDLYLGYKFGDRLNLSFMAGGGVDIDNYYKKDYYSFDRTLEKVLGYGILKTGAAFVLKGGFFSGKMGHLFLESYFEFRLNGNGSVGAEQFVFGTVLDPWYDETVAKPTEIASWDSDKGSKYKYFGMKTNGTIGVKFPLHRLYPAFSSLNFFDLLFELDYNVAFRNYSVYKQEEGDGTYSDYNITSHFDPSNVILSFVLTASPIEAIEIFTHYKANINIMGTEWQDPNNYICKNYLFYLMHDFKVAGIFKISKYLKLEIGFSYIMKQHVRYQYQDDGDTQNHFYSDMYLTHEAQPILILYITAFEKKRVWLTFEAHWKPVILLFDSSSIEYTKETTTNSRLDTNLMNLAVWDVGVSISFETKGLRE